MTINELLVLMKVIRERLNELKSLRNQVSTKEHYMYGETSKKIVEPQYDVKLVDKKITELENFLYLADSSIKASNAVTKVNLTVDVDSLLKPLE